MDTTTTTTETTYEVPVHALGWLEAKLEKLAARAAKLALALAIGHEVLRTYSRVVGRVQENGNWIEVTRTYAEVRVWGSAPKLAGWSLRARFDFAAIPGEVAVMAVPGYACPAELRSFASSRCDHCRAHRRRSDTFLLEHEDGRLVVVGRSCLADFLGHPSPEAIVEMARLFGELAKACGDGEGGGGWYVPDAWALGDVLEAAAYSIRTCGWVSSKADMGSTKASVEGLLTPARKPEDESARLRKLGEISDSDRARAARCVAWLKTLEAKSDYEHNLSALGRAGAVTDKALGIAVSAIVAWDRAEQRETERRARAARPRGDSYVGTVGARVDLMGLRVIGVWCRESAWGTTTIVRFENSDANALVWFASSSPELERGDTVDVRATVKEHRVDREQRPETVLTRVQVRSRMAAAR